mmetsp:Transcript_417/g.1424  ORF Transcript_417/g.1424 Transcript_417/m.1424 type:complete len:464 (-) Transcript_417:106-1497(-)
MPKKTHVFLDVQIGNAGGGRIVFELFCDVSPRTAENFRGLCTGEYGLGRDTKKKLSYVGCHFFRSVSGFMVQSGDFQFNNGDGGESIYGGTFNDEDFHRRHTQAGVLSMANKGRNSNGSQFFITLKRAAQLDNKHVAFGQVVSGMDVVRAIAAVPADRDDKPRVVVKIVDSGEIDRKNRNQADPHERMAQNISALVDGTKPPLEKFTEAQKAKAILAGKTSGIPDDDVAKRMLAGDDEQAFEEKGGAAPVAPKNEQERRLMELRMKMNACRTSNNKEVLEEKKRFTDPDYAKKKAVEDRKEKNEKKEADGKATASIPEGKEYMLDTAERAETREAKRKRGDPNAFGWDVFNQDSLYRAHDKRLKHMKFDKNSYKDQEDHETEDQPAFAGFGHKATDAQKDRLAQAMDAMASKKGDYSRRRVHIDNQDISYVNDRNRHFNQKMDRYFGAYTAEIKQNLERGTAL